MTFEFCEKILAESQAKINDAFAQGYYSRTTYNDSDVSNLDDEWAKYSIGIDNTALKALLKKERERCAEIAEAYTGNNGEHDGTAIAALINALEDEK